MTRPRTLVWHPFVLALYPILLAYTRNADSVYFRETLGSMTVVLLATLAGWALLRRIWDDPARAGLIASAVLFVLFSFERNVHALQQRGWIASASAREWLVLGGELALLGAWAYALKAWPVVVKALNPVANAGSLALIGMLIPGFLGAVRATNLLPSPGVTASTARPPDRWVARRPTRRDPDIYFLVLDAYGRSDVLKSMLGFDNSAFLDRMERRGFYVARQSTANYCQTALSVSATLNGEYHDALANSGLKSRLPLRDLIRENSLIRLLKTRNYHLVGFASGFGLTDGFPADERKSPALDLAEFSALVLDMTPTWTLLGRGAGQASHRRHRERILYLFDHLVEVADDPRPTFCLAHVVAPHPPFVFDRAGNDISTENSSYRLTDGKLWSDLDQHGGPEDYAEHYRAQATYITARVEQVVDEILARSPEPPVIIIQGDHGPGSHFDTDAAEPNDLAERLSILNLCLIPGGGPAGLYPTITPVNTFRLLGDHLFGTDRGLLPDRNYYSSYQSPYRVVDVTPRVAAESNQP